MYALVGQQLQNIIQVPLSASSMKQEKSWKEGEIKKTNSAVSA